MEANLKKPEHGAIILAKQNVQLKQQIDEQQETIQRLEAKIKSLQIAIAQSKHGLPWG